MDNHLNKKVGNYLSNYLLNYIQEVVKITGTVKLGTLFRQKLKEYPTDKQQNRESSTSKQSGISKVNKFKDSRYKQGYCFRYGYSDNGKYRYVQAITLKKLYLAMQERGLDFKVVNLKKARKFIDENCNDEDFAFLLQKINGDDVKWR